VRVAGRALYLGMALLMAAFAGRLIIQPGPEPLIPAAIAVWFLVSAAMMARWAGRQ
jgi:hypothetical protein